MSLISLTFKEGSMNSSIKQPAKFGRKLKELRGKVAGHNQIEVRKVCKFYNEPDLFLMGKVLSGEVTEGMNVMVNNNEFEVTSFESTYPVAKKGQVVNLLIKGLSKESIEQGEIVLLK